MIAHMNEIDTMFLSDMTFAKNNLRVSIQRIRHEYESNEYEKDGFFCSAWIIWEIFAYTNDGTTIDRKTMRVRQHDFELVYQAAMEFFNKGE